MHFTLDQIEHTDEPVTPEMQHAAEVCAGWAVYDPGAEHCVASCVNRIRFLDPDCAARFFPDEMRAGDRLLSIQWQSWSASKSFGAFVRDGLLDRSETVIVTAQQLLEQDVGPGAMLHWEESDPVRLTPPPEAFEGLAALVRGEWLEEIVEYGDHGNNVGDGQGAAEFLNRIDPFLRPVIREVLWL